MGTVDQVVIARRTGFCYGVREAIDYAKVAAAEGKQTHTLGQVVHNEGVIEELEAQGIRTVASLDEVDHGAAVVIRAHGVTPSVMASAEERGLEVIDGTCTWVLAEQRELKKLVDEGYTIVLLGTRKHPETIGLLGHAPDAIVVDEESEWDTIPRRKRMALMSQSTQPPWKFERLAAFMTSRAHELKIVNTVCPVTIRRQQDTMELAERVDLVVVVGGRTSANTAELTRLCRMAEKPVLQIETPHDIVDGSAFEGVRVVGITGGTSTPIEDLQAVAARVYEIAGTTERQSHAAELAREALVTVAEPAYRSTSIGRADRSAPVASTSGVA
ncbi:MAG TPA: 4-hydroxy-3-methylbut-2-enyl diphosphate reductase [Candidatus Limnocylindrales bacterium]